MSDFQDGYKEEQSSKEQKLINELKAMNESLRLILSTLYKSEKLNKDYYEHSEKTGKEQSEKEKKYHEDLMDAFEKLEKDKKGKWDSLPVEEEMRRGRNIVSNKLFPEELLHNFMETAGLGRVIKGIRQSQGKEDRSAFDERRERLFRESDERILEKYGYLNKHLEDIIDKAKEKTEDKKESSSKKEDAENKKKENDNIIEFPNSNKYSKNEEKEETPFSKNYENIVPFMSKVAEDLSYNTVNITAEEVKRVMGNNGIGFLYIGEILNKWLDPTKNDNPDTSDDFNLDGLKNMRGNSDGLLGTIMGLLGGAAMKTAIAGLISTMLPVVLTAATVGLVIKNISDAIKKDENIKSDLSTMYQDRGMTPEEAERKAGSSFAGAKSESRQGSAKTVLGGAEAIIARDDWNGRYNSILKAARVGDVDATMILEAIKKDPRYQPKGRGVTQQQPWEILKIFSTKDQYKDIISKYHNGGIIGQKELIAKQGEVILPVEDSNYGLDTGILKQTSDGGVSINKDVVNNISNSSMETSKIENLLEQLITAVNSNLIKAIEKNKPEPSVSIPDLAIANSYRG